MGYQLARIFLTRIAGEYGDGGSVVGNDSAWCHLLWERHDWGGFALGRRLSSLQEHLLSLVPGPMLSVNDDLKSVNVNDCYYHCALLACRWACFMGEDKQDERYSLPLGE